MDEVGIADAFSAEDVKRAADGGVHRTLTEGIDSVEIFEGGDAPRIGHGATFPFAEEGDKFFINPQAEAFDICGMNEEFGAVFGEGVKSVARDA